MVEVLRIEEHHLVEQLDAWSTESALQPRSHIPDFFNFILILSSFIPKGYVDVTKETSLLGYN
jgi:hypothetical protein